MSMFQHLGCLVLATEGREQRVRDEAASDHFVQQHLSLKSMWDRARRTQHGLFSIFSSPNFDFLGSNSSAGSSKPGGKQRGRNCPSQGTASLGCSQADLLGNFPALCQHLQESEGGDLSFLQGVPPSQHQLDNLPISLSPGITLECFKKQVGCVTPGKPELLPSAVPSAGISAAMGRTRASSWCKRASAESS